MWCKACLHRFEPEAAEPAEQHGDATTTVPAWARRLRCTQCDARDAAGRSTKEGAGRASRGAPPARLSLPVAHGEFAKTVDRGLSCNHVADTGRANRPSEAYFFSGCHKPSIAPVGSTMIENDPAFGTSVTSRRIVAPSDFALAVAAATLSTFT